MVTKSKRATIQIKRQTKDDLDLMKHPGQSYDGLIQELVKFHKEKMKEYWPRRKAERR